MKSAGLDYYSSRYVNAVVNPFGSDAKGEDHIDQYAGIGVPTILSMPTIKYTLYRHAEFTAAVEGESCLFGLSVPTLDKGVCVVALSDGGTAGDVPTGYTLLKDGTADAGWFSANLITKTRIVACGLRANIVSPVEKSAGVLTGTAGDATTVDLAAFSKTFSTLMDSGPKQSFAALQGLTVRFDPVLSNDTAAANSALLGPERWLIPQNHISASYSDMPRILASKMSLGTTLHIEYVMYLESLPVNRLDCPLAPVLTFPSNDWQKCLTLIADRDTNPIVAKGHSFNDFIRGVGDFFKKVGTTIWNTINDPKKMESIGNIARLVKSVVM